MRNVVTITGSAGVVNVPCPAGKSIRILSAVMAISSQLESDQIEISFNRDIDTVAKVATSPITASVGVVAASIGCANTDARETLVDPVTGAVTYEQQLNTMTVALPDACWPFNVTVNCTAAVSSVVGAILVAYEVLD
jgi:hypothetical protein